MKKFICIHGHFYQPPRENAWLEEIEIQESAFPFHDWNERITSECYGPNSTSRILNEDGEIVNIVNNYAKISFNFGPTLLHWMEEHSPEVYRLILKADKQSIRRFNGHGSAIAQVYNHIIMPLASYEDKVTQIKWGLSDFEKRFRRKAEGMWLAETAVDTETLEILAENEVTFTVLAPNQALKFRKLGSKEWHEGIDSKRNYFCKLPSGKSITLFFYDGDISQAVAFKGLLDNGKTFANRLIGAFDNRQEEQLIHIATDGESYGHHHKHGDMALAYCLQHIENSKDHQLTNYSEYMSLFPATHEVIINENSSWSCAHGIERWRSDCGCSTGGLPTWNQQWRQPLRESLNWLRDQFYQEYTSKITEYTDDPWGVRNAYISVIHDRSFQNLVSFFNTHFERTIEEKEYTHVLRLLEMQRHALLMFTSCAWFFDEVSGIETVQVLQYADRGIQLLERESDIKVQEEFLNKLKLATSNLSEHKNAAEVYTKLISPQRLTLTKVGMHYAVNTLFDDQPESLSVLNYNCVSEDFNMFSAGAQKLAIGSTSINSKITLSKKKFYFVILYLGQHQMTGNASDELTSEDFNEMIGPIKKAFLSSNLSLVLEIMQYYFKSRHFSFFELFRDEQLKVLDKILEENINQAENTYTRINNTNYNLLNVMHASKLKLPKILQKNLEIVVNQGIQRVFEQDQIDINQLQHFTHEINKWNIPLDKEIIGFLATKKITQLIKTYQDDICKTEPLIQAMESLKFLQVHRIDLVLYEIQNQVFQIQKTFTEVLIPLDLTSQNKRAILESFDDLCRSVKIKPKSTAVATK